ncbi:hypothetical protein [Mesorhizobium captivum]|uniref:hypothetical protein n=1 Tax=Mesorhizobium captivum TaxID=3072319 RepID=UPI002A2431CB|nr:hypothetical protein [Mesorhizobium sp. VK3C]MDX8449463.1 hypothetical protein [Mesorhizobium sp. VK3C]
MLSKEYLKVGNLRGNFRMQALRPAPVAPMGWLDVDTLQRPGFCPAGKRPPAGKNKSMKTVAIHDGQLQIPVKGRR